MHVLYLEMKTLVLFELTYKIKNKLCQHKIKLKIWKNLTHFTSCLTPLPLGTWFSILSSFPKDVNT
jgi:hypothetical protein